MAQEFGGVDVESAGPVDGVDDGDRHVDEIGAGGFWIEKQTATERQNDEQQHKRGPESQCSPRVEFPEADSVAVPVVLADQQVRDQKAA